MFNITKDDLAKQSDAQLTALFQQASQKLQPNGVDRRAKRTPLAG